MKFRIVFYGPFAVSTGLAARGADSAVSLEHPLPGSSLKGVMKHAATTIVPEAHSQLIDQTFGSPSISSVWHWSAPVFNGALVVKPRTRVRIDPNTGTAVTGALATAEEVWAEGAQFEIRQRLPLSPEERKTQQLVLVASACAVHALGRQRRRGLGWVGIQLLDANIDTMLDQFFEHVGVAI